MVAPVVRGGESKYSHRFDRHGECVVMGADVAARQD
jgi:hypothetical protein